MDVNDRIHAQLVKVGVRLAASLPDDWVNTLIRRIAAGNEIRHVPVGREAETIAICAGAFFGGVRSVAIFGNTGLLTCTGEMATLCLRHQIPVFCPPQDGLECRPACVGLPAPTEFAARPRIQHAQ